MMLFFDTETTALTPGQICQIAYLMVQGGEVQAKNFYFSVDAMDPASAAVNQLTPEKLRILSHGRVFQDDLREIQQDFFQADVIVAHNIAFDLAFLITEFDRLGQRFRYQNKLCTMKYFTPILKLPARREGMYKYPKLSELCQHFGCSEGEIAAWTARQFGVTDAASHDARFDATAVYAVFLRGMNQPENRLAGYRRYLE